MSNFQTSYDTTIGSSENLKEISSKIREAFIRDVIYEKNYNYDISPNYKLCFIDGSDTSEEEIPQIIHPVLEEFTNNGKTYKFICTDMRLFVNPTQFEETGLPHIKNYGEFNLHLDRAFFQLLWLDGYQDSLANDLDFAATVFSYWITDLISNRFALGGRDQLMLNALAFIYYNMLFIDGQVLPDNLKEVCYVKLTGNMRIPREIIEFVLSKDLILGNITEFCSTVQNVLENVRLKDFSMGMLVTLIGNSWFGVNANKILAIALEHPPTWLAVMGSAINYKGYKNTTIAKTIDKVNKRGVGNQFITAYKNILHFKRS